MNAFKVGDRVRDVYTGRTGRVLAVDDEAGRLTVALAAYTMTGCQSWFDAVPGEAEP